MDINAKIYVAGHGGLVGSALVRRLRADGANRLLLRRRQELDLTNQADVERFFAEEKPEYVFLAAAKVGGIHANTTYPAEFIRDNLAIQTNVIHSAWKHGVRKLLFLGSSCIYPKLAPQPLHEDALLTGPLEPTNEAYAVAKIAGLKMCQAYRRQYGFDAIVAMPTNLYGPGDNYHPEHSHVVPALIRRIHEAKLQGSAEVTVWGSGRPQRELLYADDLADALHLLMQGYNDERIVNVGSGEEISICALSHLISDVVGYGGKIVFDPGMPDGTPRKLLDNSILAGMGWRANTGLKEGLALTYRAWLDAASETSGARRVGAQWI